MGTFLKILTSACAAAVLLVGCNSSGCLDNRRSIPLARFYNAADGTTLTVDSLEVWGIGAPADSAVLESGTKASELYLPMDPGSNVTQWVIAYHYRGHNAVEDFDTISLAYDIIPYFASHECGAMYSYDITSLAYSTHSIDSIALLEPLVTNNGMPTMNIYFKQLRLSEGSDR